MNAIDQRHSLVENEQVYVTQMQQMEKDIQKSVEVIKDLQTQNSKLNDQIINDKNNFIKEKDKIISDFTNQIDQLNEEFKQYRIMVSNETQINDHIRRKQEKQIDKLTKIVDKFKQILTIPRLHSKYIDEMKKAKTIVSSGHELSEDASLYYLTPRLASPELHLYSPTNTAGKSRNTVCNRVRTSNDFSTKQHENMTGMFSLGNNWNWADSSLGSRNSKSGMSKMTQRESKLKNMLSPLTTLV